MVDLNNVGYVLASKYRRLILEALLRRSMTINEMAEVYAINKRSLYGPARDLRDLALISKNKHVYNINDEGIHTITFIHEKWGK